MSSSFENLLDQIEKLSPAEFSVVKRVVRLRDELDRRAEPNDMRDEFELMQEIKKVLKERREELKDNDATLLACWHVHLSGAESFNTRQANAILLEMDSKPSNTTTVFDTLRQRNLLDLVAGAPGKHKTCRLTDAGISAASRLLNPKVIPYKQHASGQ